MKEPLPLRGNARGTGARMQDHDDVCTPCICRIKIDRYTQSTRKKYSIENANGDCHKLQQGFQVAKMPRKGAAGGKKKPLKNQKKGRQELSAEDLAFKKKEAERKKAEKAAAAKLGGKKKK